MRHHTVFDVFLEPREISQSQAIEMQLLDVRLGMPYQETLQNLKLKYQEPVETTAESATFILNAKSKNKLTVFSDQASFPAIRTVLVEGDTPIVGLNFFANLNLGEREDTASLKFPFAQPTSESTNTLRSYRIPNANFSFKSANKKITAIKIETNSSMKVFKAKGKSVALPENAWYRFDEVGEVRQPETLDGFINTTADPLRPFCKSRYPLRMDKIATPYVDVTLYSPDGKTKIPATYLLDTGCTFTTYTLKTCKTFKCNLLKIKGNVNGQPTDIYYTNGGDIQTGDAKTFLKAAEVFDPTNIQDELKLKIVDGVLGGNYLNLQPIFVNFKEAYLCFPDSKYSVNKIAGLLDYKKIKKKQLSFVPLADIYINNHLLKEAMVDSGLDASFIMQQDINRLNLRTHQDWQPKYSIGASLEGVFETKSYEAVHIGWPQLGLTKRLPFISAPSPVAHSVIGMDFLRHHIIGLDARDPYLYIGQ